MLKANELCNYPINQLCLTNNQIRKTATNYRISIFSHHIKLYRMCICYEYIHDNIHNASTYMKPYCISHL